MAEVIASQGLETAQVVMTEGLTQAAEQGKKRPTASLLASIAKDLTTPAIPAQEVRSEISDLTTPPVPTAITALERAAGSRRDRVYAPLAPAAVQAALEADPIAAREHLERLEFETQRGVKRLTAANRAVGAAVPEQAEATSG
ncbi:hypothetical protein ABVB69_38400 [Streptomyces sp. NPDC000349]|uniref:hypothetical protein n=1 Tax=unclassified Streptomyces TaxID=2593676 RepID=UPI0027875111|nr:hypothetical protein [Streptomyces sp. DSM 40167]MDQ0408769.1 hypothetical protein [Streptomyces sp. DSM 40167]